MRILKFLGLFFLMIILGCEQPKLPFRVLYVNSYHAGYPPSDQVAAALRENLPADSFDIVTIYLDTKRQTDTSALRSTISGIMTRLEREDYLALLVSDDAAVQYLVSPNQDVIGVPVAWCGVNWSADSYQLHDSRVNGMLEVLPLDHLLSQMKSLYPGKNKLWILSENSLSEHQNKKILDTLYRSQGFVPTYRLVNTFSEWQSVFRAAMDSADVVYMPTNGAIANWNDSVATQLVRELIRIPVVTCDDFMMPYAVYGLTKVASEQGEFLAGKVRQFARGDAFSHHGPVKNKRYQVWFNPRLAAKIGFSAPEAAVYNTLNTPDANVPAD